MPLREGKKIKTDEIEIYSIHEEYELPEEIEIQLDKFLNIEISSIDKNKAIKLFEKQNKLLKALHDQNSQISLLYETEKRKVVLIPPTKAGYKNQIGIDDLYVYIIELSEPNYFEDSEKHEFSKIVLCTRRPFEEEFDFSNMKLWFEDDDLELDSQASSAWFVVLDWITKDIPMIMSVFTEKDCKDYVDVNLNMKSIQTLKEKILTRIVFNNRAFLKRFDLDIKELEAWNKSFQKSKDILVQKIENDLAQNDENPFNDIKKKGLFLKKWQILLLGFGWVIAVIWIGSLL